MKKKFLFTTFLVLILFIAYLIFSTKDKDISEKYPPCLNDGRKWVIGYFQSGSSGIHNASLKNFINRLAAKGWLEPLNWTQLPRHSSAEDIWLFLARNMKSKYLSIQTRHFWCSDWNLSRRKIVRSQVLESLRSNQVNMMLAMGTWAGQDLANNLHSTPTLCMESSFPIKKLFKKEEDIPEHIHLLHDPDFLLRQIRLFRKITKFKTLGVVYIASSEGRSRASLKLLKQFSEQDNFELFPVRILPSEKLKSRKVLDSYIKAHKKMAPHIDAIWLTSDFMDNPKTASLILEPLFFYRIPTWYPYGTAGVKNGAVFGVVHDPRQRAEHYADIAAKIFNGVKPEPGDSYLSSDTYLVINYAAARKVGLKIPKTLISVAKESYLSIDTGEKM
ncbi:MAG: ABC transporter substrate binding protein [Victivallaceae bacterium]|nr:ABC transporter substrate binding protein [Victivallaceae bacterium]